MIVQLSARFGRHCACHTAGLAGLLLVLLAVAPLVAQPAVDGQIPVPTLNARVTDQTGTLSSAERQALEQKLAAFERQKGSQIAVLIIPTTGPETIEGYSIRVVDQWKLGRKNVDDGVLLIVAKNDRELRIEVGYGLEGAIPDARANRIVEDFIVPRFKEGDFAGGINEGVDRLMGLIQGEDLPEPEGLSGLRKSSKVPMGAVFIAMIVLGFILRAILGRLGGAGITAVLAFVVGWIFISIGTGLILGVGIFFWMAFGGSGMGFGGGSGFSSGGGGSFGGGFSGGGGGFGGGGASGSW